MTLVQASDYKYETVWMERLSTLAGLVWPWRVQQLEGDVAVVSCCAAAACKRSNGQRHVQQDLVLQLVLPASNLYIGRCFVMT